MKKIILIILTLLLFSGISEGRNYNLKNALYIDSAKDVGIGVADPLSDLHVDSAIRISDNENNNTNKVGDLVGSNYSSTAEPEGFSGLFFFGINGQNNLHIGGGRSAYNAVQNLIFWTTLNATTRTGTERMRLTSAGDIGIGITNPQDKLHIVGDSVANAHYDSLASSMIEDIDGRVQIISEDVGNIASALILTNAVTSTLNNHWVLTQMTTANSDSLSIQYGTTATAGDVIGSTSALVTFETGGSVGIGITNPTNKLEVVGTAEATTFLATTFTDGTASLAGGALTSATTGSFSGVVTASAVDTGQGAYELYAMNQDVATTDAVTFAQLTLTDQPGTSIARITNFSVANETNTQVPTWDSVEYTYGGMTSSTGSATISVSEDGFYLVSAYAKWGVNGVGVRAVGINTADRGIEYDSRLSAATTVTSEITAFTVVKLDSGDYVNMYVVQSSGGALDLDEARLIVQRMY